MDEFQLPDLSKPPPSMAGAVPSCILESTTNQRLMMYPHYSRFPGYNEYPMFPGMVLPMAWPPSNVGIGPMQWQEQQQTNQPPAHAAMPMPWHPQFQRQGEIVPQPPAQNAMTPQPPAPPAYAALPWHPQFQRQGEIVPQPPAQNAMTPQPPAPPAYAALPWHPQFQRQEEIVPQNPLTPQTSGVHQSRIFVHQRHKPQRLLQQIPADNMNLRSRVIVTEIEDSESVGQEPAAGTEPRIGLRMNLRSRVAQVTEVQDSVDSSEGEDFEPRRQVAGGAGSSKRRAAAGAAPSGHRKSAATQFRAEEESSMPGPSKQRKRSQVQDSVDTSEGEDFEPRRQVAGGAGSSKRQAAAGAAPSGHRKSAATQSRAEESSMPGPSKQRKRDQLLDPVDDLELELKKKKLSLTQPQKKAKSRSHDTKAAEALEEAFPINRNKAATSKVIGAGKKSGNNKRRKKPEEDEEADVDDPDPVPQNQSSTDDSDEEGHEPPTKQSVANAKFSADEVINISSDEESASGELSQCEERQPLAEQDLSYEAGEDWDWPYPRMLSPEPEERKDFDCCICETVWEAGASAYKGIINCGHDNFCYHCIVAQQVNNHTCPLCYEIITDVKSELVQ